MISWPSARQAAIECSTQYAGSSRAHSARSYRRRSTAASTDAPTIMPLPITRLHAASVAALRPVNESCGLCPRASGSRQAIHSTGAARNASGVPATRNTSVSVPCSPAMRTNRIGCRVWTSAVCM